MLGERFADQPADVLRHNNIIVDIESEVSSDPLQGNLERRERNERRSIVPEIPKDIAWAGPIRAAATRFDNAAFFFDRLLRTRPTAWIRLEAHPETNRVNHEPF
jgi:hypothetical protein